MADTMTWGPGGVDDQAFKMLLETSSDEARARYYAGLPDPAYDELPAWVKALGPRDRIGRCPCGQRFPVYGGQKRFCSERCQMASWKERNPVEYSRRIVRQLDTRKEARRRRGLVRQPWQGRPYPDAARRRLAAAVA